MVKENEKEKKGEVKILQGKRQRTQIIKRTTSMSKLLTFDLNKTQDGEVDDIAPAKKVDLLTKSTKCDQPLKAKSTRRRIQRRRSAEAGEIAHFLRACSLCKRRLLPARDIYMYRGDSAYCSLDCRQQQMSQDERKEKCSLATKKEAHVTIATSSEISTNGETLAAV